MKHITIAFIATALLLIPFVAQNYPKEIASISNYLDDKAGDLLAAILHRPVDIATLKNKYDSRGTQKVRILIVPGHEPNFGGTEYGSLKERDMNVALSKYLAQFFVNNGKYEVVVARNEKEWNPVLSKYFTDHMNEIISFYQESKSETLHDVASGKMSAFSTQKVYHNAAPKDVAYRLYGINKWIDENRIDIAIHIHFNDYSRRDSGSPGKYSGFAIYVPEDKYDNSTTTRAVAQSVFKRLAKYNAVSNLSLEDRGIVPDDDLIAVGAYNTADSASMLIEYSYIYEPQFATDSVRDSSLKELAFETYLGVQDFFGSGNDVSLAFDTLVLPHHFANEFDDKNSKLEDVMALQTALILDGTYPPSSMDKNDCPRSGRLGPCTKKALDDFQKKYSITGEKGIVGKKTLEILNKKYSPKMI